MRRIRAYQILKKAREKLGLSQRVFAKRLGVSKSSYNRYERGLRKPPVAVVTRCCKILGMKNVFFRRAEDGVKHNTMIGEKISLLRKLKLFPLKALSYRSGISYNRCRRIEKGKVYPTRKEVRKLASALGFSPSIFRKENFIRFLSRFKKLFAE
jgi:transcriptional regulator with XRE-family HTH domain